MRLLYAVIPIALALAACAETSPTTSEAARAADGLAPLVRPTRNALPDRYIVLLNEPAPGRNVRAHISAVAAQAGVQPHRTYQRLNGFAARMTGVQLQALRRNPAVRLVEQDRMVQTATTQTFSTLSLWGLDRIDEYARPLSGSYTYTNTGSGVSVYVIDTGIMLSHAQFGSRAHAAFDAYHTGSDPDFGRDDHGHGTHVAGIIGATKWGAAKGATLYSVRVLERQPDGSASGAISDVVAGIEWVIDNHASPAVANLSLSSDTSAVLDDAVENLVAAGVFVSVAAGNGNTTACSRSPARVADAFTVAASDSLDARASFSNYGSCVDAYAPGKYIGSAWFDINAPSDTTASKALEGTSMSAPFISGVAALYLEDNTSAAPSTVAGWITTNASENKITGNPVGTPNLLLNKQEL
jgi:subtilisin family serine protease